MYILEAAFSNAVVLVIVWWFYYLMLRNENSYNCWLIIPITDTWWNDGSDNDDIQQSHLRNWILVTS